MSWFMDHAVLFALVCAGAAVVYGLWLTSWLLAGVESKAHLVMEGSQVYPLMELGLRLGIRG